MNVYDTDARFVIDPVSGDIENQSLKETIARYSHNSEVFTFEIPRNIGHDPVECNLIEIHYLNINARNKTETSEGIYKVNDICECAEDATKAVFTWTIDGSATAFAGTLSFSIHFKCIDSEGKCLYRLPIKTYSKITVTDAIDNSGVVMEDNQDIIAEWEARISALEENDDGGANALTVWVEEGIPERSAGDIYSHIANGGVVTLHYYDELYSLLKADETAAWFGYIDDEGFGHIVSIVGSQLEEHTFSYVNVEHFNDVVGDISTALDHIIELQEELIG